MRWYAGTARFLIPYKYLRSLNMVNWDIYMYIYIYKGKALKKKLQIVDNPPPRPVQQSLFLAETDFLLWFFSEF